MCDEPMACANVGLGIGWTIANIALLVWTWRTKPPMLLMLRLGRISIVIAAFVAGVLALIGFGLGLVTAPLMDVLAVAGCVFMIRMNLAARRWAIETIR